MVVIIIVFIRIYHFNEENDLSGPIKNRRAYLRSRRLNIKKKKNVFSYYG